MAPNVIADLSFALVFGLLTVYLLSLLLYDFQQVNLQLTPQ